jgi:dipeptide/tripeptide permease
MHQIVRSNSVTILWQLPQIFVITVGEILFAVTGLEFSYSQAAPSMKSVSLLPYNFINSTFDIAFIGASSSLAANRLLRQSHRHCEFCLH